MACVPAVPWRLLCPRESNVRRDDNRAGRLSSGGERRAFGNWLTNKVHNQEGACLVWETTRGRDGAAVVFAALTVVLLLVSLLQSIIYKLWTLDQHCARGWA